MLKIIFDMANVIWAHILAQNIKIFEISDIYNRSNTMKEIAKYVLKT